MLITAVIVTACSGKSASPTTPTPTPTPTVASVSVSGTSSLQERGSTAQFTATVTLSNGTTEDRTASATWQSDNTAVATVSAQGVVTAVGEGAVTIMATVSNVRGSRSLNVKVAHRTPDPPPGQRLPLPDVRSVIEEANARRPELLAQSCPNGVKYANNPWLDYILDQLRTLDTRWGYNAKPTRTAADNGGSPVISAGDEIAYHYSAGPDQGSPDVYLIDILASHCTSSPQLTYRVFTGEEPGIWTGAGRF
jgi:hypothetical protein